MEENSNSSKVYANGAEGILSTLAWVIMIIGILISIGLIAWGIYLLVDGYLDEVTGTLLIVGGALVFCLSFVSWASIKVMCNISNNVREVNRKTKG